MKFHTLSPMAVTLPDMIRVTSLSPGRARVEYGAPLDSGEGVRVDVELEQVQVDPDAEAPSHSWDSSMTVPAD
eukprot:1539716-Pyramimonas_sp.AAC.1